MIIDNWFTSVQLTDEFLKNHKFTILGTIRKNKTQLPREFKITKSRPVFLILDFGGKKVITSYRPKNNKIVLLLSTMHNDNSTGQ